jgi:hypothetical protein
MLGARPKREYPSHTTPSSPYVCLLGDRRRQSVAPLASSAPLSLAAHVLRDANLSL